LKRIGDVVAAKTGQRRKSIEEVVHYAVSHYIRVHILIVLNEGTYTAGQIAEIIGESPSNVSNHIHQLLDAGSIEIAEEVQKANLVMFYYRAVEISYYSREEAEKLTFEERQMTAGLLVQQASAEVMAALYAGHLADPRAVVAWDWHNLDQQGREDLEDEEKRFLERAQEIEVEATNRRADSGEEAQSMLLTVFGYERGRKPKKFPRP
jgi:DNA-binding transcriptional ArsR family regulator